MLRAATQVYLGRNALKTHTVSHRYFAQQQEDLGGDFLISEIPSPRSCKLRPLRLCDRTDEE